MKQEQAEEHLQARKQSQKLRRVLALDDYSIKLDKKLANKIRLNQSVDTGDLKKQNIYLFAQKTHLLETGPDSVKEFTNYQIELLYKKIEVALMKT